MATDDCDDIDVIEETPERVQCEEAQKRAAMKRRRTYAFNQRSNKQPLIINTSEVSVCGVA